jgi:hypothetical protein
LMQYLQPILWVPGTMKQYLQPILWVPGTMKQYLQTILWVPGTLMQYLQPILWVPGTMMLCVGVCETPHLWEARREASPQEAAYQLRVHPRRLPPLVHPGDEAMRGEAGSANEAAQAGHTSQPSGAEQ